MGGYFFLVHSRGRYRKVARPSYQFDEHAPGPFGPLGQAPHCGGMSEVRGPLSFTAAEKTECCLSNRLLWHFGHVP